MLGFVHHKKGSGRGERTRTSHIALRFNEFVKIGFDKGEPLLDTPFDISTSLTNISH